MVGPAMDCLNNPLGAVRTLFDKASVQSTTMPDSRSDWGAKELFDEFLFQQGGYQQVPEINSTPLSAIPNKTLVRFRGMVQDMFDVEYYIGAYKDGMTWHTTKFTDVMDSPIHENSETAVWDRRLLFCVPVGAKNIKVPGESSWVKEAFASSSSATNRRFGGHDTTAMITNHSEKRLRETENCSDVDMDSPLNDGSVESKRLKEETNILSGHASPASVGHMPMGESGLLNCIVKVYDGVDSNIGLNDIVEFIGVLTSDPELTTSSFLNADVASDSTAASLMEEPLCSQLPSSRAPRLHSITFRKLSLRKIHESFPLTEQVDTGPMAAPEALMQVRDSLMKGLTNVLGGDHLTAEYLLLHLLSQVHHRVDSMAVGKLSLNIVVGSTSAESSLPLTTALGKYFQALLPCSRMLSLSLHELNKEPMAPRKDYSANRLVTGSLQVAEGTYLTLDETALSTGQLNSIGIQNIQSLKHLMEWQKVEYEFEYYKLEMVADIPVLVISHAKSRLLPADAVIPLRLIANVSPISVDDINIARWRLFLGSVRNKESTLDPSMQKFIENELVNARQQDPSLTPEALHRWLTLARLLSLSYGESTLSLERWQRVREMERLCGERLS